MLNASASQIHTIMTTTESVGAKVPAPITAAYAEHQKIYQASSEVYVGGEALTVATYAALLDCRDPAADPEVQRILTSHQVGNEGVMGQVRAIALGNLTQALRANADDLISAWQKPFNAAAQTIAAAHEKLGGIPLAEAQTILRKGGDSAEWWTKGSQADLTIDSIVSAWTLLALQSGFVNENRRQHLMKFTDPTLAQWEEHQLTERRMSAWDAYSIGLRLDLAEANEYRDRIRRHEELRQQRERAQMEANSGKMPAASRSVNVIGAL